MLPLQGYGDPWAVLCIVVGKSCLWGVWGAVVLIGGVVAGLWVSALCLGFLYREAYLLGSGVSEVCRSLNRLGVDPNRNSLGTLPGGWGSLGLWISLGSLTVWVWVFLWGLGEGLVSADLVLCLFVGMMAFWAFWAFCWWSSSIVLYGFFWVSIVS